MEPQQTISDPTMDTPLRRLFGQMLHSQIVEYGMSLIILGNFALIIMETNIRAKESETEIPAWMNATSWSILIIFTVELIMRLYVERLKFFKDSWNVMDFIVISLDLIFSTVAETFGDVLPISLLRILRLGKVARISKVVQVFPELRLLLGGLIGAIKAILWGTVLMVIAMLICSVLAVQFIHPLNKELAQTGYYEQIGCPRCGDAFATVERSALTFWQQILSGDSWGQVTVPLIEEYPATALYFLASFLLLALALHNLILGVIVDVAQESRKKLQADNEKKKMLSRMESQRHLLKICMDLDADGSKCLTKDEMKDGYNTVPEFRAALNDLDVSEGDLDVVWLVIDRDKSGSVDYQEFVTELYNMRSSESQFMLTYVKYYVTIIKDRILEEIEKVEQGMAHVESEMKVIEEHEKEMDKNQNHGRVSIQGMDNAEGLAPEELIRQISNNSGLEQADTFSKITKDLTDRWESIESRLVSLDHKMDWSIQEQRQRMRGSVSWSLPIPCQSVSSGTEKVIIQTPANSRKSSERRVPDGPAGARANERNLAAGGARFHN